MVRLRFLNIEIVNKNILKKAFASKFRFNDGFFKG